jgi:hypothetical protein
VASVTGLQASSGIVLPETGFDASGVGAGRLCVKV